MDIWTRSTRIIAIMTISVGLHFSSTFVATSTTQETAENGPEITLLGDPTPEERTMVEWALRRFELAGLELPDLRMEFKKAGCRSRGLYDRSTQTIQVCDGRKMTLLHELAHSWDHFATFDRDGFLALRGLQFYFGPPDTRAADQGVEHIAEIIAWGLMDENTAVPGAAYPSQPVAEYQPQLPGLPNSGIDELHDAFVYLTGIDPLHSDRAASQHPLGSRMWRFAGTASAVSAEPSGSFTTTSTTSISPRPRWAIGSTPAL